MAAKQAKPRRVAAFERETAPERSRLEAGLATRGEAART